MLLMHLVATGESAEPLVVCLDHFVGKLLSMLKRRLIRGPFLPFLVEKSALI